MWGADFTGKSILERYLPRKVPAIPVSASETNHSGTITKSLQEPVPGQDCNPPRRLCLRTSSGMRWIQPAKVLCAAVAALAALV